MRNTHAAPTGLGSFLTPYIGLRCACPGLSHFAPLGHTPKGNCKRQAGTGYYLLVKFYNFCSKSTISVGEENTLSAIPSVGNVVGKVGKNNARKSAMWR
jgi:hypothetical protein